MKDILLNLQSIIRSSTYLKYINEEAVIISEVETDIENISLTLYPAIMIMPGPENALGDNETFESIKLAKSVEIIIVNHYLKEDTIVFGDKNNIGILNFLEDMKKTIYSNPYLDGAADGWLPGTFRVEVGFLPDLARFTIGRRLFISYKDLENMSF